MSSLAVAVVIGVVAAAAVIAVTETVQAAADWLNRRHPSRRP